MANPTNNTDGKSHPLTEFQLNVLTHSTLQRRLCYSCEPWISATNISRRKIFIPENYSMARWGIKPQESSGRWLWQCVFTEGVIIRFVSKRTTGFVARDLKRVDGAPVQCDVDRTGSEWTEWDTQLCLKY